MAITEGQTVEVIAEDLRISRETVRCQLKSVLSKTASRAAAGRDAPPNLVSGQFRGVTQMGDADD
jgi:hypothetical protein